MNEKTNQPGIVFFGTPDFAVASLKALLDHSYKVLAVVTAPDKPAGRGRKLKPSAVKEFALAHQLPVLQPTNLKNLAFQQELADFKADLQVVVAFRMLPKSVWDMPKMGTINVHGSLLPQYRGAAPINHALINGEKKTGVTTFLLKHEIDTGDLLLQKEVIIEPEDNYGTLYLKLMEAGAELLTTTITGLLNNSIAPQPQKADEVLHPAPKIHKEDCIINWNQEVEKIHNFIRGLAPVPGAETHIEGDLKIKILESDWALDKSVSEPMALNTDNKNYLKIAGKDGWLIVKYLQPSGKKVMGIKDFLNGHKFNLS